MISNLLSFAWIVLSIITVQQLQLYFHVLKLNGLPRDRQYVSLVQQVILVNQEAHLFLAPGTNGTPSMIEFALNVLLDLLVLTKT